MLGAVAEARIPASWLIVARTNRGDLVYEAGWRHRDAAGRRRTLKRRLGPAWLEDDAAGHRRRRGRVQPGFLDEHAAIVAKDALIREVEEELARSEADATTARDREPTFRDAATRYLRWLAEVKGAKPSTLQDHGYLLAEPGAARRRTRGTLRGVIMQALGDRPAGEIDTRDVNRLLEEIAGTGASPRTVNKHRQLICAIYNYACSPATLGLAENPATEADRRPEPERARLDYFAPNEIESLAGALENGLHRESSGSSADGREALARSIEDRQDADLVRLAAYTGLRRGELVALRWSDVELGACKIIVRRAVSANQETTSTKSRRAREVPLPDQAAAALSRLRARGEFVEPDDFVFVNRHGRRIDGSALRRRVERARDAVGLRKLRFHDLRHTYGSLLVAGGVDLASVKAAMGHSRITTTERYLHARSASELADRFTKVFDPS